MSSQGLRRLVADVVARHTRMTLFRRGGGAVLLAFLLTTAIRTGVHLLWESPTPAAILTFFAVTAIATAAVWRHKRLSDVEAARLIDRHLDLNDRLSTSVEYAHLNTGLHARLHHDAARHVSAINLKVIVPLLSRFGRAEQAVLFLVVVSVALWIAPLPSGLLAATAVPAHSVWDEIPEGEELLQRIAALRDRLAADPPPEARRLQRDLEALQEGLRDRTLRAHEAESLLDHLERRAAMPWAASDGSGAARFAADALDGAQEIANRLRSAANRLGDRESGAGANAMRLIEELQRQGQSLSQADLERALEQLREGDEAGAAESLHRAASQLDGMRDADAGRSSDPGSDGDRADPSGQGRRPIGSALDFDYDDEEDDFYGMGQAGMPSAGDHMASGGQGDGEDDEFGESGSAFGTLPSDAAGSDGNGAFQRAEHEPGDQVHLSGSLGAGPLHAGSFQASPDGVQGDLVHPMAQPGQSGGADPPFDTSATSREDIPIEYREIVRRYFRAFENGP